MPGVGEAESRGASYCEEDTFDTGLIFLKQEFRISWQCLEIEIEKFKIYLNNNEILKVKNVSVKTRKSKD